MCRERGLREQVVRRWLAQSPPSPAQPPAGPFGPGGLLVVPGRLAARAGRIGVGHPVRVGTLDVWAVADDDVAALARLVGQAGAARAERRQAAADRLDAAARRLRTTATDLESAARSAVATGLLVERQECRLARLRKAVVRAAETGEAHAAADTAALEARAGLDELADRSPRLDQLRSVLSAQQSRLAVADPDLGADELGRAVDGEAADAAQSDAEACVAELSALAADLRRRQAAHAEEQAEIRAEQRGGEERPAGPVGPDDRGVRDALAVYEAAAATPAHTSAWAALAERIDETSRRVAELAAERRPPTAAELAGADARVAAAEDRLGAAQRDLQASTISVADRLELDRLHGDLLAAERATHGRFPTRHDKRTRAAQAERFTEALSRLGFSSHFDFMVRGLTPEAAGAEVAASRRALSEAVAAAADLRSAAGPGAAERAAAEQLDRLGELAADLLGYATADPADRLRTEPAVPAEVGAALGRALTERGAALTDGLRAAAVGWLADHDRRRDERGRLQVRVAGAEARRAAGAAAAAELGELLGAAEAELDLAVVRARLASARAAGLRIGRPAGAGSDPEPLAAGPGAEPVDAGLLDAGPGDAEPVDAGLLDAEPLDTTLDWLRADHLCLRQRVARAAEAVRSAADEAHRQARAELAEASAVLGTSGPAEEVLDAAVVERARLAARLAADRARERAAADAHRRAAAVASDAERAAAALPEVAIPVPPSAPTALDVLGWCHELLRGADDGGTADDGTAVVVLDAGDAAPERLATLVTGLAEDRWLLCAGRLGAGSGD